MSSLRVCKACGQQFGCKSPYLEYEKDNIQSIAFYIGGYFGTSHYIYIDSKRKSKITKYACIPGGLAIDLKKPIPPELYDLEGVVLNEIAWTNLEWDRFIEEIAACNVEYWKDNYSEEEIRCLAPHFRIS